MSLKPISFICDIQRNIVGFGGGSQTSTQKTDPWSGQQPYLTNLFQSAQNQYQNFTPQYYGAQGTSLNGQDISGQSTVAGFNPTEDTALQGIANTGLNGSQDMTSANTAVGNILNSDPSHNPYFGSMANEITSRVQPQLESQFVQGNMMNSPAAAYATSQGLGDALGSAMFSNYNQGIANQLGASGQAQSLYGTGLSGQQAALGAGQTAQQQAQNQLSNNVNMFNYQQQLPYNQINQYSNLINGQYGMSSTTTTPQQSPFGSLFSDRRLKENIERIGMADNGLPIYAYTFKSDRFQKTHIGFMADEVEQVHPEAVHKTSSGYLMVSYAKAVLPVRKEVA